MSAELYDFKLESFPKLVRIEELKAQQDEYLYGSSNERIYQYYKELIAELELQLDGQEWSIYRQYLQ